MMKFLVKSHLGYDLSSDSTFILNIGAVSNCSQQVLEENLQIEPAINYEEYVSPTLKNRMLRLVAPPGKLQISYQATIELSVVEDNPELITEIPPEKLPLDVLEYIYPSRYCESDRLFQFAQVEFGHLLPGYSRVTAICNWIYDHVTYLSGSSDSRTSTCDIVTQRAGVCRDFAHLGIALCRALNIPARFVSNYAYNLEPPDFHATFEAYLGSRWYSFDATRLVPRKGLIRIGTGRDAADVSFATIFGAVQMEEMNISVDCLSEDSPQTTVEAVSNWI